MEGWVDRDHWLVVYLSAGTQSSRCYLSQRRTTAVIKNGALSTTGLHHQCSVWPGHLSVCIYLYVCMWTVFAVGLVCTGLLSAEVEVRISINVSLHSTMNATTLLLRRTKTCLTAGNTTSCFYYYHLSYSVLLMEASSVWIVNK